MLETPSASANHTTPMKASVTLRHFLAAAKTVDPRIQTEWIDLGAVSDSQSMRAGAWVVSRVRGQYFGTERSISLDHAVMPPFTLFTRVKPCSRRNWSAFMERPPDLQNR